MKFKTIAALGLILAIFTLSSFTTDKAPEVKKEKASIGASISPILDSDFNFVVPAELRTESYSTVYAESNTYVRIVLSNGASKLLVVDDKVLPPYEFELIVKSFNSMKLKALVEAPTCDVGFVSNEEYIGTNFVKLTCDIPHCCGPAQTTECKTYNPYTHRWQATSCSPWNYE
jgi:hypothetical protein